MIAYVGLPLPSKRADYVANRRRKTLMNAVLKAYSQAHTALTVSHRVRQLCSLHIAMFFLALIFGNAAGAEVVVTSEQRLLGAGRPLVIQLVAESMRFDGMLSEWRELPADIGLPGSALKAQVWIAQHPNGIVIAGTARSKANLSWQIRLASMPSLHLPPLGWLRAITSLERLKDCDALSNATEYRDNCKPWFLQQASYRAQLASLFIRNYSLDSSGIRQTQDVPMFSGTAFDDFRALLQSLAAGEGNENLSDNLSAEFDLKSASHTFELLIPWSALPATDQLDLKQLYLQIDLCISGKSKKRCFALAQPSQPKPNTGPNTVRLILAARRQYRLSQCNQKLPQDFSFPNTSYFLPASGLLLNSSITFKNPGGGYLNGPAPNRISPEAVATQFTNSFFGADEAVCTPNLSYLLNGEIIRPTRFYPEGASAIQDDYVFENFIIDGMKRLDSNRTLFVQPFKLTPSASGEGVNGACDQAEFSLWIANRDHKRFTSALILGGYGPDLCAGSGLVSAELSSDLQTVNAVRLEQTASEEQRRAWGLNPSGSNTVEIAERFCLAEKFDRYEACGQTAREVTY